MKNTDHSADLSFLLNSPLSFYSSAEEKHQNSMFQAE